MKYIAMNPFKELIRKFCKEVEMGALKFVESPEFKKSVYNELTADELLDTIMQEDREDVRTVLVCFLHFKLMDRFYQSSAEKEHFTRFKGN